MSFSERPLKKVLYTLGLLATAGLLSFNVACAVPIPTPTPKPSIECNRDRGINCTKDGKEIFDFRFSSRNLVVGTTAEIYVFVSPDLYNSDSIGIYYTDNPHESRERQSRILLGEIPVGKRITLKFKPNVGCFSVRIPDLAYRLPLGPTDSELGPNRQISVGRPTSISIKTDSEVTEPYRAVLISGEPSHSVTSQVWVYIRQRDGNYEKTIALEDISGHYSVNWFPEKEGIYEISAESNYYGPQGACQLTGAVSDKIAVQVTKNS